jgi:hypothetical protein
MFDKLLQQDTKTCIMVRTIDLQLCTLFDFDSAENIQFD